MNVRTILLWGVISILLLVSSCQTPTEPEQEVTSIPTSVRGMVMRNDNLAPIANAVIYDIGGLARDTSKGDGTFRLVYQLLSQTKTRIIGSRAGYGNDTAAVTLNPGVDTTIVLRLKADSTSPSGPISSGKAANIVLVSSSSENISIRGTGSNETALLTFEVRDSLGIPIGGANKLRVNFSILGGPEGGEYVFPVYADTDPLTGRVTTRISSGTKAGVLQLFATATVPGTTPITIKSSPVKITISGGLPVAERVSVSRRPVNIAGGVYDNLRSQIMVIAGDKYGNPVQPGTAVYFTTTGGIIQATAVTDKDGIATVDLISANPRPQNSVAIVTARTIGDSGTAIEKKASVLFSGATRILTPTTTVFVPDSGTASFEYRVQDPNGFPLVAGTTIALSVEGPGAGQLELFGDVTKTLEDTESPAATLFKASVRDKVLKGPAGLISFKVTVTSQNGNSSATFDGFVSTDTTTPPPVITPAKSGYVSSLTLVGITTPQISVRGTGANETARLTFIARDSVGNPVEIRRRAYVTFSLSPTGGVGGGEFLFPAADSTDASGQVGTTFNAGTRSGVIQVIARTDVFGRTITSMPVKITISGGLPDSNSFTATLSKVNMPGLVKTGTLGSVSVQVGDKFGNAVQSGTALYFSTTGGLIQATATTNDAGQASASIQGGNPVPNEPGLGGAGHGYITVQTVGENGVAIRKRIPFLFSGAPAVNLSNVPTDTVVIAAGGTASVNYRVEDLNGNPVSSGHTVTVTASGAASSQVDLTGDLSVTTADTRDKNAARYQFKVSDKSATGGVGGLIVFAINVTGESGSFVKKFYGVLLPGAPSPPPQPRSGYASSLTVGTITTSQLSVRGTGATEAAKITFVAKDSVGNLLDIQRKALVNFSITPVGGLGGGEFVSPASSYTDSLGQVSTTFNAGTKSGVVQIVATANVLGRTITSTPVRLTIFGGLPDSNKLTVGLASVNMPGLVKAGALGTVNVQVGDKFGNPVQPNTALSFSTSGGLIQASAATNDAGQASATIYGGNPAPNEPSLGGPGHGYITVQTVGENGVSIRKSVAFLFSGETRIVTPTIPINVPDSGAATFQYRVQDPNGSPLVAGTSIVLTVDGPGSGQLELSGDVTKTLLDSDNPNTTLFTATVRDKMLKGPAGQITFRLSVTSPNGNATATFNGLVLQDTTAVPPITIPPTSGYASNLTLESITSPQVSVRGTGANETARLIFIAKDSVGNPIEIRRRAYVTFSISPTGGVGGGEFLYPAADSTDANGRVGTTFSAGVRSGVLQVVAQTIVGGRTITSSPIRITISGGLPDSNSFTATLSKVNMPGLVKTGMLGTVSVQVGDKFGNPAQPGTALYFSTSGGVIFPTATTDALGQAITTLQGGNPAPNEPSLGGAGFGYITVQTVGEGGVSIQKKIPFLFSGAPRVSLLNVPSDTVKLFDGASFDVDYMVDDINSNPISAGHNISVTVSGQGASGVRLSGDINVTTPDTQDKVNFTRYRFRAEDAVTNGGPDGGLVFTITVSGESKPSGVVRKFYGVLYSPQVATTVPATARQPAQIAFLGITAPDIYVAGVGNTENSVITYEVRDSLGIAIDKSRRVYATYSLQFYPNNFTGGGTPPTIIPAADSTDDSGKLRTSIVSGTQAGVIQLVARITLPGGTVIVSQPVKVTVHAGFADQPHFTLIPSRFVFPGFDSFNSVSFTAAVGDTFSNPVQAGTAIYFHSQAGIMQTGQTGALASYTDATGLARATLFTVNPRPGTLPFYDPLAGGGRLGYQWVYSQTQGRGGRTILDSVLVVWNRAPIVTTGIPTTTVVIPQAGTSNPISITVKDVNGNPLCDGTTITTVLSYTTDVVGISFGVSGGLSSSQQFIMPVAGYARYPGPGVTDFTFYVSDLSTGGGATIGQSVLVTMTIAAPGLATSTVSFSCVVQ